MAARAIFGATRGGGVFFGSGWGQEGWAGEVPYGDRPGPSPSPALAQRGHPAPRRPWHHASTHNSELSRPSPKLLRSHFARCWPLPCLRLGETSHPFLPPGAATFALKVYRSSDREADLKNLQILGSGHLPGCSLASTAHSISHGPVPSAWHDLCHHPGGGGDFLPAGFTLSDPRLYQT